MASLSLTTLPGKLQSPSISRVECRSHAEHGPASASLKEFPRLSCKTTTAKSGALSGGKSRRFSTSPQRHQRGHVIAAANDNDGPESNTAGAEESTKQPDLSQQQQEQLQQQQNLSFDDVNPVGLGRRSRQFLDDVWRRLIDLGQLARPAPQEADEEYGQLSRGDDLEFAIPSAEFTTVLVAGATGRVGRVLVRKLLLRGYKVKALVRSDSPEVLEQLPRACQVVVADLGDPESLQRAVSGCNKIVFCAAARSTLAVDLQRVEHMGVVHLSKAFMDYNHKMAQKRAGRSSKSKALVLRMSKGEHQGGWQLGEGRTVRDDIDLQYGAGMDAEFTVAESGNGVFSGYVFTRGGYVEAKRQVALSEGLSFARFEGLVFRLIGDGKPYNVVLRTQTEESLGRVAAAAAAAAAAAGAADDDGEQQGGEGAAAAAGAAGAVDWPEEQFEYVARVNTRKGHNMVRVPFSASRPSTPSSPPLDPSLISSLGFRFEQRRPKPGGASSAAPQRKRGGQQPTKADAEAVLANDPNSFRLELQYVKAFPGGEETDFVLVSCSGAGVPEESREKVAKAKAAGETQLRMSGLGYTIVRPGPLLEEPGGSRALVFDQGNRITQGISCADVADVCVKALHDPTARNKSFDICYEYADNSGLYELVAHVPNRANNYLTPALALLEKNT